MPLAGAWPRGSSEQRLPSGRKHSISLNDDDRRHIDAVLNDPATSPLKQTRAKILLLSSEGLSATQIMSELGVGRSFVSLVKRGFVEHGVEAVLGSSWTARCDVWRMEYQKKSPELRKPITPKITPEICDEAAELHEQGKTYRELADKFGFSHEGIRQAIHRRNDSSPGR